MPESTGQGGRAARWRAHNAERRRLIVQAAIATVEAAPVGADLEVQQVAERSGIARTVLYRHFDGGKDELAHEVQAHAIAEIQRTVEQSLSLDKTIDQLIRDTLRGYVDWVDAHRALYVFAARGLGGGHALGLGIAEIANGIIELLTRSVEALGAQFRGPERTTIEVVTFGVLGQVRGTVEQWIRLSDDRLPADLLTRILARSIWFQLEGQARDLGVELRPDVPIVGLIGSGPGPGAGTG